MKIQLLPSTFDQQGRATAAQHLSCYIIDDCVAIDAGSLALALTDAQRRTVRDVIVTHPHMDHIATLPLFIDDLFATLEEPVRVHATAEVIELLERNVFNWEVYPRFTELSNDKTRVMQYVPVRPGEDFKVGHLRVKAVAVNHVVPTIGMVFSDGKTSVAFSSDTASTEGFWQTVNAASRLDALLIESSFPNSMALLAEASGHYTPATLSQDLRKLSHTDAEILVVHVKPAYRELIVRELEALKIPNLRPMEPGREYEW